MKPSPRCALTLIEVMIAVSLASFVAAIGFTGVNAFGKAITRSKQFTAETQVITACLRYAVRTGDVNVLNTVYSTSPIPLPTNYPTTTISGNTLQFSIGISNAKVGGTIRTGLQTDSTGKNSLIVKAIMAYQ
jgi:prepilin-type N-terminal cleavage/methylation domain-containing protein